MMKKNIKILISGVAIGIMLLTGCNMKKNSLLPEKIVANAMEVNNETKSYYAESKMKIWEKDKVIEDDTIKEWMNLSGEKTKTRSEINSEGKGSTISTNNGDKIVVYMKNEKKALVSKAIKGNGLLKNSQKDQIMNLLKFMKKSHEISTVGEEKINGIATYHLKAVPKEKDNIFGKMDIWVNEENWFVVKMISQSGNTKTEFEYTKIDFSPKFDKSLFEQDIPSNVKIENLEDGMKNKEKNITFKEAADFIGKPVLCIPESLGYKLKTMKIEMYDSSEIQDEIILSYEKDGNQDFSISIRKKQKQNKAVGKIPGEKDITVRGKKGTSFDDVVKLITWDENDASYSFMIKNPDITMEDAKKIIEKMDIAK